MKKDICREKGITLIALVVTIVILLILASVSISMLTGENGIIKQSQEAKENTKIGEERELVELSATAAAGRDNFEEIKKENLKEELDINIGEGKYTLEGEWPFKVTYNDSGRSYIVNKYGKVEFGDNSEQASNIKWIYEENEDGNIEIIGIDLSDYKDGYTILNPDAKFDYLKKGFLDVSLEMEALEVPAQIDGKKVVSFNLSNFGDFSVLHRVTIRGVKTINFANDIETVGRGGNPVDFSDLENVKLPANLKNLDGIFAGSKLTNINIPGSLTSIGYRTFSGCTELRDVNISEGVSSISYKAFSDCTSLASISLPESVTEIGYEAFSGCTALISINISEGLTTIEYGAFSGCTNLTNINLPNTVTGIESMGTCFESTTTVNFPQGKNDALEIPSSKWGAGKITINGVEYTT